MRKIVDNHQEEKHLKRLDRQWTLPGMPNMASSAKIPNNPRAAEGGHCRAWKKYGNCYNKQCQFAHLESMRGCEKGKGKNRRKGNGKGKKGAKGKIKGKSKGGKK